jgi:TPP-dependent pyruvate/acetoin dehydrogenase alpha subunit
MRGIRASPGSQKHDARLLEAPQGRNQMSDAQSLLDIFEGITRCMLWEQGLLDMQAEGRLSGFYHAGRGQEGVQVGAVSTLAPQDYLLYAHRGCGYMVARGMPMEVLYADFLGFKEGSTRGLGAGIVHIAWPPLGILGQSGTLGGSFTLAVGAALSARIRGSDAVTMCFFGDGTANRGTFHEAANAAGVWKLPVVWVCENNGWAVSGKFEDMCAGASIAGRAAGYGMPGVVVDGQDATAVHKVVSEAVERARNGGGPTLIEALTCRFRGHYEGDSQEYRDRAEVERLRQTRDPLDVITRQIQAQVPAAEARLEEIRQRVAAEVTAAANKALAGSFPATDRIFEYVYA